MQEAEEIVSGELFRLKNFQTQERESNLNNKGKFQYGSAARRMVRVLLIALVALAATGIASAQDNTDAAFKGGIGVIPVTGVAANGAVNLNVVRGVSPGSPWRITALEAEVKSDGHIKVVGRRLLLANGNGIGTNAGANVFATLFCGPAASASAHSSNRVALEDDGDFRIDGFLDSVPPTPCDTPVLLIRNGAGAGVWFAAGIPKFEEGHEGKYDQE